MFTYTAQNQWIRESLFDGHGNYLYCQECILAFIRVGSQRLSRQRKIKQELCQHPVIMMSKCEVSGLKLEKFVVLPSDHDNFQSWWNELDDDEDVEVCYPHEQHGLQGKTSNRAKTSVMNDFLTFVDNNSTPNGHQADSRCPTFYFLPKFRRIDPSKTNEKDFSEKSSCCLVGEFNRAQESEGKATAGAYAIRQWLKQHRPKVAIHPHKVDYCDTCKRLEMELSRHRQIIKRLCQSGSTSADKIVSHEQAIYDKEQELKDHKTSATESQEFYRSAVSKCSKMWGEIESLVAKTTLSTEENKELASKKHVFTLIISVDYQQSKLTPYWGSSAQPGSTYYLQKVSHDVFGLIDHRAGEKHITLFDERIGPKNTDHTISILQGYIKKITELHPWLRRVLIFLDNAASTNKNRYLFSWGMEIVEQRTLDYVRFCFMVAGHTKFAPDRLFAQVSNSYNRSDVFTIDELKDICALHAHTTIEDGAAVMQWRKTLCIKYSDLPGTRKYHDYLIARSYDQSIVMKVRESCCKGSFSKSPLRVIDPDAVSIPAHNYKDTQFRNLSIEKFENMKLMYDQFVPSERRPDYLPPPSMVINSAGTSSRSSSFSAPCNTTEPPPTKKPRKQCSCSTPGCNGTGHKNPKHWDRGHTTRAGCPLYNIS